MLYIFGEGIELIKDLDIPEEGLEVWLREFGQVKVFRTTLKDKMRKS